MLASIMERDRLLEHLSSAKRHVEEGDLQIAAQKCVIVDLKAGDSDTTEAETLLGLFELDQQPNLADVEHILDVLDNLPPVKEAA